MMAMRLGRTKANNDRLQETTVMRHKGAPHTVYLLGFCRFRDFQCLAVSFPSKALDYPLTSFPQVSGKQIGTHHLQGQIMKDYNKKPSSCRRPSLVLFLVWQRVGYCASHLYCLYFSSSYYCLLFHIFAVCLLISNRKYSRIYSL